MRKFIIRLTDSARRYADRHQIVDELMKLDLDAKSLVGDLVSLESGDRPHDFIIASRRWIVASEEKRLELTLDHPVRRGRG
jgi:hypothetical protein